MAEDILTAYSKYGFYIFEGVLAQEELQDIEKDLDSIRESYPSEPNGKLTKDGKPALGADCLGPNLVWSKPLGDPLKYIKRHHYNNSPYRTCDRSSNWHKD